MNFPWIATVSGNWSCIEGHEKTALFSLTGVFVGERVGVTIGVGVLVGNSSKAGVFEVMNGFPDGIHPDIRTDIVTKIICVGFIVSTPQHPEIYGL
jgi:hypothetical protein